MKVKSQPCFTMRLCSLLLVLLLTPSSGSEFEFMPCWKTIGQGHGCELHQGTHQLKCWGNNAHGQATPPQDLFAMAAAGAFFTCGLTLNGFFVTCFGANEFGQSEPPRDAQYTAISAGGYHACGLKPDGRIECWGRNVHSQCDAPTLDRVVNGTKTSKPTIYKALSTGWHHTCGLRVRTTDQVHFAECWGNLADRWHAQSLLVMSHDCALRRWNDVPTNVIGG